MTLSQSGQQRARRARRGLAGAVALLGLAGALPAPVVAAAAAANPGTAPAAARHCSIARGETLTIAAWDLDRALEATAPEAAVQAELAAMLRTIDADVVALQGLGERGDDHLRAALRALGQSGRCYATLSSGAGTATLYDPREVEARLADGPARDCRGMRLAAPALRRAAGEVAGPAQVAQFRVAGPVGSRATAFDFTLLNVDVARVPDDLRALAAQLGRLDGDFPALAGDRDRIVLGDIGIDGARATGEFFPGTKALINLLLKINIGLSDKTFDQAVAGARGGPAEPSRFNDNILVRRWDQPGLCPGGSGYCGGLEEFINARVHRPERAGALALPQLGPRVHPPVAARFCRHADSDAAAVAAR